MDIMRGLQVASMGLQAASRVRVMVENDLVTEKNDMEFWRNRLARFERSKDRRQATWSRRLNGRQEVKLSLRRKLFMNCGQLSWV